MLALRGFDVSIKSLQVKCLWGVENSDLQLELNVHVLGYLKIALKPAAAEDVNGESDRDQGGSQDGSPRRKKRRRLHIKSPKSKRRCKRNLPEHES